MEHSFPSQVFSNLSDASALYPTRKPMEAYFLDACKSVRILLRNLRGQNLPKHAKLLARESGWNPTSQLTDSCDHHSPLSKDRSPYEQDLG